MNFMNYAAREDAEVLAHRKRAIGSELLKRKLIKHHYDHAPKAIKDRFLPVIPIPIEKLFAIRVKEVAGAKRSYGEPVVMVTLSDGRPATITRRQLEVALEAAASQSPTAVVSRIQRIVCSHFQIEMKGLLGPRRAGKYVRPRLIAVWLAWELTNKSSAYLGHRFNRDHTTILNAIDRVSKLIEADHEVAEHVEILREKIMGTFA